PGHDAAALRALDRQSRRGGDPAERRLRRRYASRAPFELDVQPGRRHERGVDTGSTAAFHAEGSGFKWIRLFSPQVTVPTPPPGAESYLTVDFDVATCTEDDPARSVLAYDGLCLR